MGNQLKVEYFKALASFKGQLDGLAVRAGIPCDLSGKIKGNVTASDVLDQIQSDVNCAIPEENKVEVLQAYEDAYNKVATIPC